MGLLWLFIYSLSRGNQVSLCCSALCTDVVCEKTPSSNFIQITPCDVITAVNINLTCPVFLAFAILFVSAAFM